MSMPDAIEFVSTTLFPHKVGIAALIMLILGLVFLAKVAWCVTRRIRANGGWTAGPRRDSGRRPR